MATETFYFSGTTKWAKVRKPDDKYNNYQVPLYLDEESKVLLKKSGVQLKYKADADGEFVTFRRNHVQMIKGKVEELGPPEVYLIKDGEKTAFPEGHIGNGSKITVKVQVYDTMKGKGHRLIAVGVNELVEYNPEGSDTKNLMPF